MKKINAYPVYLAIRGAQGLLFATIFTVNMVYQANVVGLNPLQLVLVGTTLEAFVFLFEIPTGVVADVYSRRLSVIIGFCLIGLGFIIEGSLPYFWAVLLAQAAWGIGYTFISGALSAWITDEPDTPEMGQVYLRGSQVGQVGGLLGIGVSVALAGIYIQLPIVVGGVMFVGLALFLVLFMPEDGFHPTPAAERDSWQSMHQTLREGIGLVRRRNVLLALMGLSAFYGLYSEGFDRLWTPHLLENFTFPAIGNLEPVVWFGIISAISSLLGIMTTQLLQRLDTGNPHVLQRGLFVMNVLVALSVIGFGLAGSFPLALAAYWLVGVLRTSEGPFYEALLNQNIDSRVRATVISLSGQLNAIGQVAGGPAVGAIGTAYSLRAALTVSGALRIPALLLFTWLVPKREKRPA